MLHGAKMRLILNNRKKLFMKVKELIEKLKDCNEESEVVSNNEGKFYYFISRLEKGNISESNNVPIVILIRENMAVFERKII